MIDPVAAMQPGAPVLHPYLRTKGAKPGDSKVSADKPTNIVERYELGQGDVDAGFKQADVVVERSFDTKPMHQGYIEPQSCVATCSEEGEIELWCCTQAPFVYRDRLSEILKVGSSKIKVQQSELGGGFGGKTGFYAEPVAIQLARKARRPVKITFTRAEVFKGTGPVSGTASRIKIGAMKDGTITAADAELIFQTGPYTGSAFTNAPQAMFTRYDLKNVRTVSYEVVSNRPKVASFRAPCVPQVVFGVEGIISELADKIGMDQIDFRLKNAMQNGATTLYKEKFGVIGFVETLAGRQGMRPLQVARSEGLRSRHLDRLLVQPRRRDVVRAASRPRRLGDDHARHRGRGRLPHLDLDDGGRGARHSRRQGARRARRHASVGLQPRHRRQPHHLFPGRGAGRLLAQGGQGDGRPRRAHLEGAGGGRDVRERHVPTGHPPTSATSRRCRSPTSRRRRPTRKARSPRAPT